MKVFIFLIILTTCLFAHNDYTDRFSANKINSCSCEHTTTIENAMPLPAISNGVLISKAIPSRIGFNSMSITCIADIPQGAGIKTQVSVYNGTWSPWQSVTKLESDIHFTDVYNAYRYQIELTANGDGDIPQIYEVQIAYNFIFSHTLQNSQVDIKQTRGIVKPRVISRSEWKARSPKNGYTNHTPRRLTIHHTYRPLASDFTGASTIRSIQNYHMDSNGWSDIGYHFIIGNRSRAEIYQGRPETVVGAHVGGANTNNVGVNVVGDYDIETIHHNSYKALIHTLAWLCDRYRINPNDIFGHKDFNNTKCPGNSLYRLIPQIKEDVRNFITRAETAATGTLIGVVYDSAKGTTARISGATVTLSNGQKLMSDSSGTFRFQLNPGNYSYTTSKSGYKAGSTSRNVTANNATWGSVGLMRNGSSGKELSGPNWVRKFPPSRAIKDLTEPFKSNMTRFYNALKNSGTRVSISNTLRPPQRAYLMHYAYRIAKEGLDPRQVPPRAGVNIEWWHGSMSKSVSAARQMVSAYGIVYRPSLTSNHIRGEAIDMSVSWSGTLRIKNASGSTVSIGSPNSGASNRTLWAVGKSYGVLKLANDAPHWSRNGH